jgi:hypothetical protein
MEAGKQFTLISTFSLLSQLEKVRLSSLPLTQNYSLASGLKPDLFSRNTFGAILSVSD